MGGKNAVSSNTLARKCVLSFHGHMDRKEALHLCKLQEFGAPQDDHILNNVIPERGQQKPAPITLSSSQQLL